MIRDLGRNLTIRARIFLGFAGAMSGFIIASVVSIYSLYKIDGNFDEIEKSNSYIEKIVTIDTEVSRLQKNVTVYMYTGHSSVRRVIQKNQEMLNRHILELLEDSSSVFDNQYGQRLKNHLDVYMKTFAAADVEYQLKNDLIGNKMPKILRSLQAAKGAAALASTEAAIYSYLDDPSQQAADSVLVKISAMEAAFSGAADKEMASQLKKVFVRVTQAVRSSLYLVNVVMSGEALEFIHTSRELKTRAVQELASSKVVLDEKNKSIRFFLTVFFIVFPILMIFYSWYVSSGISMPLARITETFTKIKAGHLDITIPEQDRKDEIGSLSKAAEIFRERTKNLEDTNDELSQFAYRTSHDLKAPLVSIIGLTGIIDEDLSSGDMKEARKNLEKVDMSARRLEVLIGDILSLSKSDAMERFIEPCDLALILDSIKIKLDHLASDSGVEIVGEGLDGRPIKSQRIRIEQILENLVSNAVKYSDPEKPHRYVTVALEEKPDAYKIVVSDNGLGIAEKYQTSLFQMFKRFHTKKAFGSGLGLYLVKKHLQKMDASIVCRSMEGEGSEFEMRIPK